jgi:hypothetical protein
VAYADLQDGSIVKCHGEFLLEKGLGPKEKAPSN